MKETILLLAMLFCVLSSCAIVTFMYKKDTNIVKILSVGTAVAIVEYLVMAVVLLIVDRFCVKYTLVGCVVVDGITCFALRKKIKIASKNVIYDIKKYMIIIILVLVGTWFGQTKAGDMMLGFDAGMYSETAIDMIQNGSNYTNYPYWEEYETNNQVIKEANNQLRALLSGIYNAIGTQTGAESSYHGLHVWPTLLALWGRIFGIKNMFGILSVLYVIMVLNTFFLIENLSKNTYAKYLSIVLGLSPIMIYLQQHSLSEMLYMMLTMTGILCIYETENKLKVLGGITLSMLGFVHLTTFVYLPGICVFFAYLAISKKDVIYNRIGMLFSVSTAISIVVAGIVSSSYTYNQLVVRFGTGRSLPELVMISASCMMVFFVVHILLNLIQRKNGRVFQWIFQLQEKRAKILLCTILSFILVVCCVKGYLLSYTTYYQPGVADTTIYRQYYVGQGIKASLHLFIVTLIQISGFIAVPCCIAKIYTSKQKWNSETVSVILMFLYSLAVCTILYTDATVTLYLARYVAIYAFPFLLLALACFLKNKKGTIIIIVASVLLLLPFDICQVKSEQYKGTYDVIEDTISVIENDAIVFVENNSQLILRTVANLKNINHNEIYLDTVIGEVLGENTGKSGYIVTSKEMPEYSAMCVLEKNYEISSETYSVSGVLPLKASNNDSELKVFVYKIQ